MWDHMSNKMLKICREPLLKPLAHLCSLSLRLGYMPPEWKRAKIIPIFKKGDTAEASNYRPISLLSTFSKVIEKVVSNRIYAHFNKWNLFTPLQFGFRSRSNCENLLIKFTSYIAEAKNNNESALAILVDFAKAFDTVCFDILIKKLKYYKVPTKWIESYLKGRTQFVQIGNETSKHDIITCGVPQGSILSALLFLIYVNCLPNSCDLTAILFADDTTLLMKGKDINVLFTIANLQLKSFEQWCYCNRLSLAPSKTRFLIFSNSKIDSTPDLYLMNQQVKRVHENGDEKSFKLVGVQIQEDMSWKLHTEYIRKKVLGILFMMKNSKHMIPARVKKMLFSSLVQSVIHYALPIWGGASKQIIDPLVRIEKRAIRLANNAHYIKHTDPMFGALGVLKLTDMYKILCARTAVKFLQNTLPEGNMDCFKERMIVRNIRSLNNIREICIPKDKSGKTHRLCTFQIPTIWNKNVPFDIKNFEELSLVATYKKIFIDEYNLFTCTKEECYSCNMVRNNPLNIHKIGLAPCPAS